MENGNVLTLTPMHYEPAGYCLSSIPMPPANCQQLTAAPADNGWINNEQSQMTNGTKMERRKPVRFDGCSEEEIFSRRVPDHLAVDLDILMIGTNPGPFAAYKGHHYAGPGNHFWKCLHMSGLVPEPLSAEDDYKLIQYGIGFTNIVDRATRTMADLRQDEIKDGAKALLEKLRYYRPRIAVFNGKEIYRLFSGKKEFCFGKQPFFIDGTQTIVFVMPSSSARFSQLPRVVDKVPYFVALKKLRDHIRGELPSLSEREIVFSSVLAMAPRKKPSGKDGKMSKAGPATPVNEQQRSDLVGVGDMGLDESGRPILPSRLAFDLNLINNERMDMEDSEEYIESASFARQSAMEMITAGDRCSTTPTTDLSEFFIDPLPSSLPQFPPPVGFNVPGLLQYPTTSQDSDVGANGESGGDGSAAGSSSQQHEQHETGDEETGENGEMNAEMSNVVQQDGNYQQPTPVHPDEARAASVTAPHHSYSPPVSQHQLLPTPPEQRQQQQINGAENMVVLSTPEQSPTAVVAQPVQQQETPSGGRHHTALPPDVARHVEEAIENVIQRAREGPLEMPAFRTQAEKAAAVHAHHHQQQHHQHQHQQQHQHQHQQQHQHQNQHQQHQQQQQQQQQMLANLQAHAAAMAAAAHFDLSGGMKSSMGMSGGTGQGASSGEQAMQNTQASSLYQYFQPQQPHQSNQTSFGVGNSGGAGGGNGGATMSGSGTNYGQWPTVTTNAGQQMTSNLYNPTMPAQFYPNFAPPTQSGVNQQLYSAVGAPQLTSFSGSPYFPTTAQQQQQVAAMYGQYAAGGGFVNTMQPQQQQQQQQQSPHNL